MTLHEFYRYAQTALRAIYTPAEIQYLTKLVVEEVTQSTYTHILANSSQALPKIDILYQYIEALQTGKPWQYIFEKAYFLGYEFRVTPAVLIPRPETEMLVEKITQLNQEYGYTRLLDIGTGSGCIAISAKIKNPHLQVDALDISPDALAIAQENAMRSKQKIHWIQSDIFEYEMPPQAYDMIVSNPPYVSIADKDTMQTQVVNFEPHIALFVPAHDMLLYYKRIVNCAWKGLKNNGHLIVEIEKTMGKAVVELVAHNFKEVKLHQDCNGMDRMIVGKKCDPARIQT